MIMRLTTILFSTMIAAIFIGGSAFTPAKKAGTITAGDWFFLEDKKVGFGVDHDVIHFGNWKDDVRQIKLRVTDGPLKMYSMNATALPRAAKAVSLIWTVACAIFPKSNSGMKQKGLPGEEPVWLFGAETDE
jgi:hypothetical protein